MGWETGGLLALIVCLELLSLASLHTCEHTPIHTLIHKHGYRQKGTPPPPRPRAHLEIDWHLGTNSPSDPSFQVCLLVAPVDHGIGLHDLLLNCSLAWQELHLPWMEELAVFPGMGYLISLLCTAGGS